MASHDNALNYDSTHPEIWTNRGNSYYKLGEKNCDLTLLDSALYCFDRAVELDSSFYLAIANQANIFMMLERYKPAMVYANRALSYDSTCSIALYCKGIILGEQGRLAQAITVLENAKKHSQGNDQFISSINISITEFQTRMKSDQ
ncbi:MAG: hypothetical protein GY841_04840 [FCB group bacterium]|nr:hypothetical protein [FCB group bacterium]